MYILLCEEIDISSIGSNVNGNVKGSTRNTKTWSLPDSNHLILQSTYVLDTVKNFVVWLWPIILGTRAKKVK